MNVRAIQTPIFKQGDDLISFIIKNTGLLKEKDILIVTSKIVALSQGQVISKDTIPKKKLVEKEADVLLGEVNKTYLTIKNGIIIAASGIDESNARDNYILWPSEPFKTAEKLWKDIRKHYNINQLGIIFSDSRCSPLRKGITGVALSYWGFSGLKNHIGKLDLFGRPMEISITNVADSLTTAAVLLMGESSESCPLAVIDGYEADFRDKIDPDELLINKEEDIFAPLFKNIKF